MYKTITNNTYLRLRYLPVYAADDTAFTAEEIDRIITYTDTLGLQKGMDRSNVRNSDINFMHKNPDNTWIFERLNKVLENMNEKYFNFEINGYDYIQYSVYEAAKDGRYDFHIDMGLGEMERSWFENRKLSMTLLLTEPGVDFKGGDLEFNVSNENNVQRPRLRKGTLVLFPSFLLHRVTPVTEGIRKSLVIWLTGPKFK